MYVTLWPTLGPPLKTCWSHQLTTNRIKAFDISLSELWHNNLMCLMLKVAKRSCALHAHTTQFHCPNNVIEVVHLKLHKNACAMKYSHTGFGGLTTDPILLPFPFLDFYISIHLCMYCVCVLFAQCGANAVEPEKKLDTLPDQHDKAWKQKNKMLWKRTIRRNSA